MKNQMKGCFAAVLFACAGSAAATTTLNALFMTQAAYSENDIRAMTQAFQTAHPDVQVNLEFVPYEALHDKIVAARRGGNGYDVVLFDAIWPAEFSKFDLLQDVSSRISADEKENLPRRNEHRGVQRQNTGHAVDPRHQISLLQQSDAGKSRHQRSAANRQQVMDDARIIKQKNIVKYPLVWSWSQAEALV